jgi:hypothetical protein
MRAENHLSAIEDPGTVILRESGFLCQEVPGVQYKAGSPDRFMTDNPLNSPGQSSQRAQGASAVFEFAHSIGGDHHGEVGSGALSLPLKIERRTFRLRDLLHRFNGGLFPGGWGVCGLLGTACQEHEDSCEEVNDGEGWRCQWGRVMHLRRMPRREVGVNASLRVV